MQAINVRRACNLVEFLRTTARGIAAAVILAMCLCSHEAKALDIEFIGVTRDPGYREADAKLCSFLKQQLQNAHPDLNFMQEELKNYFDAIEAVKNDKFYVARLTPYTLVAAKMLGAEFEEIATYHSKATDALTYHAYFAVNRNSLEKDERLYALLQSLQPGLKRPSVTMNPEGPLRFVYHDQFSTSSFLLPCLDEG